MKAMQAESISSAVEKKPSNSLYALFRKEMADHIASPRFWIILAIAIATTAAGIYAAVNGMADAIKDDNHFVFLKLYTISGSSIPSYSSFMGLIGPFIGLMLGFDAVNSEHNNGTLNRLLAQPIYRDSVIIGKFLAGTAMVSVLVLSTGVLIGTVGFLTIGLAPTGEELARVAIFLFFTIVYICFWLALAILFSVLCRHAASSALISIALWIVFAIFWTLIASAIANGRYPITNEYEQMVNQLSNYNLQQSIDRISPYYLFSEAASTILNPAVRALNAVTMSQLVGALNGFLPLSQSLLLVWPDLLALAALTLTAFAISYIRFIRQEIRT